MLFNYVNLLQQVCEFGGDDCIKSPSVVDRTAHRYSKRLLDRVGTVYNYLKETCNLPDIPHAPTKPPPTRKKQLKIRIPDRPISLAAAPKAGHIVDSIKTNASNNNNNNSSSSSNFASSLIRVISNRKD